MRNGVGSDFNFKNKTMAKYKLLTQDGYAILRAGSIYDERITLPNLTTVGEIVSENPTEWELVEEKQEKRPIMTYIILSVVMTLYLYAGLAETNWPLIPATIMGFYLLFKIERNGRKKIL